MRRGFHSSCDNHFRGLSFEFSSIEFSSVEFVDFAPVPSTTVHSLTVPSMRKRPMKFTRIAVCLSVALVSCVGAANAAESLFSVAGNRSQVAEPGNSRTGANRENDQPADSSTVSTPLAARCKRSPIARQASVSGVRSTSMRSAPSASNFRSAA